MKTVHRKIGFTGMALVGALTIVMLISCQNPLQDTDDDDGDGGQPSNLSVVYVSTEGNDENDGSSPDTAKRTISEALLRVADGGDIKIAGGIYNETLVFAGSVNLLGSHNEAFTATDFSIHPAIIDGTGLTGSVISGSNGNVELRELILKNGTAGNGGGVNFNIGSLDIVECWIIDNTATEWGGGGINVGDCELTISDSKINNNLAPREHNQDGSLSSNGGGINAGNSTLTLENVEISYNECNGNSGGGVSLGESTATFTDCTFTENTGVNWGGGVNGWESTMAFDSCVFTNNYANSGGGGLSSGPDGYTTTITNCDFTDNSPNAVTGDYINEDITYTAVTPDHGDVFDTITLTGSGFGAAKPTDINLFLGTTTVRDDLLIHSWSDTEIVFYVPNVSITGEYSVQLADSGSGPDPSLDIYPVFTVDQLYTQQTITTTNTDPEALTAGGQVTITGTGYTPVPGSITVSGYECEIISWSETVISFTIPLDLEPSVYALEGEITTPFGLHGGSACPGFYLIPEPPQLASNNYQQVQFQGQDIISASEYLLLRSDTVDGEYSQVASSSTRSMTDLTAEPSTTYYYAYRGINGGNSSLDSLPLEVTTSADTNMYTVTFYSQGGSSVSSQEIGYGNLISEPDDPIRTGYTFNGWYTESGCTNVWEFASDTVTGNTELFAGWTVNQYTVSFDSDGGSTVESQTIDYGGLVSEPSNPTKPGYLFNGWHSDSACNTDWDFSSDTVTQAVTLYAEWIAVYNTLVYDGNYPTGGTVPESMEYLEGSEVTVSENTGGLECSQDGISMRFVEWNTDPDGHGDGYEPGVGTFTMGSSDVTLYAQWDVIGGTGPGGGLVFYDQGTASGTPTWRYLEVSLTNAGEAISWGGYGTDVPDAEGSAIGSGWTNTQNIVSTLGDGTYAAKVCYDFLQNDCSLWFLPAVEELDQVFLNLYENSLGNFDGSDRYWCSTEYNTNSAYHRGYGQDAYPLEKNNTYVDLGVGRINYQARPIHAFVSDNALMVHFDSQALEGPADPEWIENISLGSTLASMPTLPSRVGYVFEGWYTQPNGSGSEFTTATIVKGDTLLYAHWIQDEFTVTYDGNGYTGGIEPTGGTYTYDDTFTVSDEGTLVSENNLIDYRFTGWNTAADGSGDFYEAGSIFTVGIEDVTLYAQWDVIGGIGPGGGYVFYDSEEIGEKGWRYMEAAPVDQSGGIWWWDWETYSTAVGTSTELGAGAQNTIDITFMGDGYDYAAGVIWFDYSNNGYSGWLLPSLTELVEMYNALHVPGILNFSTDLLYWSSSESSDTYAFTMNFSNGSSGTSHKGSYLRVRGVRFF